MKKILLLLLLTFTSIYAISERKMDIYFKKQDNYNQKTASSYPNQLKQNGILSSIKLGRNRYLDKQRVILFAPKRCIKGSKNLST